MRTEKYMYSFSEALSNRLSLFSDIIYSTLEFGVWSSRRDFGSLSRDKKVLKKHRDYEVEFIKQVIRKIPQVDDPFYQGMCPYGPSDLFYTHYYPKFKKSIPLKVPSLELAPPTRQRKH